MSIDVFEGERTTQAENFKLGRFTLEGMTPKPARELRVSVTFEVCLSGLLHVTAT